MFESEPQRWHKKGTVWPVWTVILALWVSAPALFAQEKPVEKCVFEGIARNTITQIPVPQVSIRLVSWAGKVGYSGISNSTGGYHFEGLEPGDYTLMVDHTGYSGRAVLTNKSRRSISELHLAPGQTVDETELWLTPDGGIAGRVLGPDGEPLAGARVELIARQWQRGKRVYLRSSGEETNGAGEYRFPWVWRQNENVVYEQSRNVVLTAPNFGDAGRTATDDPSRKRAAGCLEEGEEESDHAA